MLTVLLQRYVCVVPLQYDMILSNLPSVCPKSGDEGSPLHQAANVLQGPRIARHMLPYKPTEEDLAYQPGSRNDPEVPGVVQGST